MITHELRGLDEGAKQKAPVLAITTRAMRGNLQADKEMKGQEEYSSDEAPHLPNLKRVARTIRMRMRFFMIEKGHTLFTT